MKSFIIQRLLHALLVILLVTMVVFLLVRLLPGDPIMIYVSQSELDEAVSPEALAALRHQYGLDRPLALQYISWLWEVVHGDLGISIFTDRAVVDEIKRAMPVTLYLNFFAWVITHLIGPVFGVIAAVKRAKWQDTLLVSISNISVAVPEFWLAVLMVYWFAYKLGWFPIQGYISPFQDLGRSLHLMTLPIATQTINHLAGGTRMMRASLLEVLRQDYIRTARAKGLREGVVLARHAFKVAFLPLVTGWGMSIHALVGGTIFIENIFNIPGMGRLGLGALFSKDYAILQAGVLIAAVTVTLANLLTDIAYGWFDPRIRVEKT